MTQISGLGDKAFSGVHDVKALFGNYSIDVSNLSSDAASEALIKGLQQDLTQLAKRHMGVSSRETGSPANTTVQLGLLLACRASKLSALSWPR